MNNIALRTLIFVGVAVVCVGGAVATSRFTEPVKLSETTLVGEEFYPDFQDPTKATALRVAAYDKDAAEVKVFNVEFKDGLWRIPSHHFYPADGEEQLARTAASIVGIKRGTYAGKTAADQKRMGVLDPLDDSITGTEGRGSRITLYQGDKALVDLIIGNKLEGSENDYYVRKADDPQVFRAELAGLKISTKFADWIEPDLLKLDKNKLTEMVVDRYHIDEQRGALVQEEVNVLKKPEGATAWTLEGLNAESEKTKTSTVNQMTFALDDLKIVGVRPKPDGLVGVLTGEKGASLNQLEILQMQRAGFFLTPDGQLVSNEGEILAGTNEGVRYSLRFGEVISGSDLDIEVGAESNQPAAASGGEAESTDASAEATDGAAAAAAAASAADAETDAGDDSNLKSNRYLFITASFDESLLGERPQPPVKPEPPAGTPAEASPSDGSPAPESSSDSTDTPSNPDQPAAPETGETPSNSSAEGAADSVPATDAESPSEEPASPNEAAEPEAAEQTTPEPAAEPAGDQPETKPVADDASSDASAEPAESPASEPADPEAARKAYEEALQKYEADQASYDARVQSYDAKVEAGKKLAKDLNERFAAWYYVIAAEQFDKLHVARADLVEPVTPAASGSTNSTNQPGGATPSTTTEPATTEPAANPDNKPEAGSDTEPESATDSQPGDGNKDANPDQPQSPDSSAPNEEGTKPEQPEPASTEEPPPE